MSALIFFNLKFVFCPFLGGGPCVVCSLCGFVAVPCGAAHVLSCKLSYWCIQWLLSRIVITLLGKTDLVASIFFSLKLVFCPFLSDGPCVPVVPALFVLCVALWLLSVEPLMFYPVSCLVSVFSGSCLEL